MDLDPIEARANAVTEGRRAHRCLSVSILVETRYRHRRDRGWRSRFPARTPRGRLTSGISSYRGARR